MSITQLPTAPSRQDPGAFAQAADTFLSSLPQLSSELNSLATSLNNLTATNAGYVNSTAAKLVTANSLLTDTQTLTNSLERLYLGSINARPGTYTDGTAVQPGALLWHIPSSQFEYRVAGGNWTPLANVNTATSAAANVTTANSHLTSILSDASDIDDIKAGIDAKYIGSYDMMGISDWLNDNPNPPDGLMHWSTTNNALLVWSYGSVWKGILSETFIDTYGGIINGNLTAPSITATTNTQIVNGIGIDADYDDRIVAVNSPISATRTIDVGVLQATFQPQTSGAQNVDFTNYSTIVGTISGSTFLTCTNPPPAGCIVSLTIKKPSGFTATVTFSTGFKMNTTSINLSAYALSTVSYKFISDGVKLKQLGYKSNTVTY